MTDPAVPNGNMSSSPQTIPSNVYHHVSNNLKISLQDRFLLVTSPIENSKKASYTGSIMIFAAQPRQIGPLDEFLRKLGRMESSSLELVKGGLSIVNFDVAWPDKKELSNEPLAAGDTSNSTPSTKFIKVKLHIWLSKDELMSFRRAKIELELMKLLGKIISKPYGLSYNPHGLYLRIEAKEDGKEYLNRYGRAKITGDRDKILGFLGLDVTKLQDLDNFRTWEDLMKYAVTCRFYDPARWTSPWVASKVHGVELDGRMSQLNVDDSGDEFKTDKKHARSPRLLRTRCSIQGAEQASDKSDNMNMFNYWTKVYLPTYASVNNATVGKDASFTYADVISATKQTFPGFSERYKEAKATEVWSDIRKTKIPKFVKGAERTYVMKGLKAVVKKGGNAFTYENKEGEGALKFEDLRFTLYLVAGMVKMKPAFDRGDFELVLKWAKGNWMYAGAAQKWFSAAKSAMIYKKKKKDEEEAKEKERLENEAEERKREEEQHKGQVARADKGGLKWNRME